MTQRQHHQHKEYVAVAIKPYFYWSCVIKQSLITGLVLLLDLSYYWISLITGLVLLLD